MQIRLIRTNKDHRAALAEIEKCRGWWSEGVYAAFAQALDRLPSVADSGLAAAAPVPVTL